MSCKSYRVVFSAPMPTGSRTQISPYRDERQMNLSYMVLLDTWNMFGQKFLSFHRRLVGWAGATEPPDHNKSMRT